MELSRSRRRFLMFLGAAGTASWSLATSSGQLEDDDPSGLPEEEVEAGDDASAMLAETEEEVAALEVPQPVSTFVQAYFTKPYTAGQSVYRRYTPIGVLKSGSALEFTLRSAEYLTAPAPVRVNIYGPPPLGASLREKGRVVASAVLPPRMKSEAKDANGTVTRRRWVFDWQVPPGLTGGNYILDAEYPGALPASVVIANGIAPPLTTPRKLAVCTANMKGDRPGTGHTWFWVDYPAKRRSFAIESRPGTKFTEPMSIDNMWIEDMTTSTGAFLREPIEIESGWIVTNPQQRYSQNAAFVELGDLRGGKRIDGRPGCVVSGTAFGDGLYALTPIGAFFIDLAGEIKPLFGRFMKPGALYPYGEAVREKNHHLVGVWQCPPSLKGAMSMCVTRDRGTAYVADSNNNRILKADLTTSPVTVSHLAGRYISSADAKCAHSAYKPNMSKGGQVDGQGDSADFGHPIGVLLSDDEQTLYIGDDHNCAIRSVNLKTRQVKTVVQSHMVHPHAMLPLGLANVRTYRETMSDDGSFDHAHFMHVGQMAWDSKGRIIAAVHHSFEIRRFDLKKRTTERVGLTEIGSRTDMQKNAWVALDVDRTGELGVVDRIVVANWFAGSEDYYLPMPDDSYSTKQDILRNSPPGYPRIGTGPARHIRPNGYPWFVKVGPGCLWIHDSSDGQLTRVTQRRPSDPLIPSIEPGSLWTSRTERHTRGGFLWSSEQPNGDPPRFLMHGTSGANQLGFELSAALGAMSDAGLAKVLNRSQYDDADWEAILAYLRTITLTSRT